jgi:uncharacterized protein
MAELFLGKGWSFPPTFDNRAKGVVMTEGEDDIRASLEILLGTRLGERIMRPGYGTNLDQMLFDTIDATLVATLEKDLQFAIALYEPRIDMKQLAVLSDRQVEGRLLVVIDYIVRSTNTRNNLVYPFYLNEGTEARIVQ